MAKIVVAIYGDERCHLASGNRIRRNVVPWMEERVTGVQASPEITPGVRWTEERFQHHRDPAEQASLDFAAVDLVEHFVASARIEIVRNAL